MSISCNLCSTIVPALKMPVYNQYKHFEKLNAYPAVYGFIRNTVELVIVFYHPMLPAKYVKSKCQI